MTHKIYYFFLACLFVLQGCGNSTERSLEYLESAKAYFEQENYAKAKLELKNALQINDKLDEAFYYSALINEKNKNWGEMYGNLAQSIKLNPQFQEARLKLAKLYLLSGNKDKAQIEVDWLLANVTSSPDVIALNGLILLKQGDSSLALVEAEKALQIDPGHTDTVSLQVAAYLSQKDYQAAETTVNKALKIKPDELALSLLKLKIHSKTKDHALIEQDYKEIINQFPSKLDFSYALAKFYLATKRETKALSLLENVVKDNPEEIKPKLVLVEYLLQQDQSQAELTLRKFISENPNETDLYFKLANLYILQKKNNEAKKPLIWIVEHNKKEKKGLLARVILAKFAVQEKDNPKASKLINEVLNVNVRNYDALVLRARISLIDGENDQAITYLRGILRDYSKSDEAMVLLGQGFLKKGMPELAYENFRNALEVNPANFSAVMPIVSRMIKNKDIGRADEILQKALTKNPGHEGALQALAQIRLLNKDWQGTKEIANMIANKPTGGGFSEYLSGKVSQGQGLYEAAITKYKLALSLTPTLSDALKNMVACFEKLKLRDKALIYIDSFMQKNPQLAYPSLYKNQLYVLNKDWTNAVALLNQSIDKWPREQQFYVALAGVYKAKNEPKKVVSTFERGLGENPANIQMNMLLASAYEVDKDYGKAIKRYEAIISKKPDVDVAVNNLVSLLLDHYPSKENSERAVNLSKRFENSKQSYFLDTYGWALLQNGNVKKALSILKQAASINPEATIFKYHLGVAYHRSGDNELATKTLTDALNKSVLNKQPFVEKEKVEDLLEKIKVMPEM